MPNGTRIRHFTHTDRDADRELLEETEFMLPLQEQSSQKKALKMRMMKIERELQDYTVNADFAGDLDILPSTNPARLDSLPPGLQQYVQAIADGLRSLTLVMVFI